MMAIASLRQLESLPLLLLFEPLMASLNSACAIAAGVGDAMLLCV